MLTWDTSLDRPCRCKTIPLSEQQILSFVVCCCSVLVCCVLAAVRASK